MIWLQQNLPQLQYITWTFNDTVNATLYLGKNTLISRWLCNSLEGSTSWSTWIYLWTYPYSWERCKTSHYDGPSLFNFGDGKYRLLNNRQVINPICAVYHKGRDIWYYFATNGKWKSAFLVNFPSNTQYVLYRSGNLQRPDWMQIRHSLMTPSSVSKLPHVSFPPSAFWPVNPTHDPQMPWLCLIQPKYDLLLTPSRECSLGSLKMFPHLHLWHHIFKMK